jgi:hypothetical protein
LCYERTQNKARNLFAILGVIGRIIKLIIMKKDVYVDWIALAQDGI